MKHLSLKFALFSALFFAPVIISGCGKCDFCGNDCSCEQDPDTFYKIKNFIGSNYLSPAGKYDYKDVKFYFKSEVDYYTKIMTKGGASLYATPPCACYDGEKGSKEKIKDIVITSNKNYTNAYQVGTNLSPLMSIESMHYPYNLNQQDTLLYSKQKVNEYISKKTIIPIFFSLIFDLPPTQDKKHIFTIHYELDNGAIYTYTTPEITFQ